MMAPVSDELRAVEREVDTFYQNSTLLSLSRSQAMWHFLAECEEWFFRRHAKGEQIDLALVDVVINFARWPLRWLWEHCRSKSEEHHPCIKEDYYEDAHKMACLGYNYGWFEAAFTYASMGRLSLELDGDRIRPKWIDQDHIRYDAYDRLRDSAEGPPVNEEDSVSNRIAEIILPTVRLRNDRFEYGLNPSIFKQVYSAIDEPLSKHFRLPEYWSFPTADLSQYLAIVKALWVFSSIHSLARYTTPNRGLHAPGYRQSVIVMERGEIIARLRRYLGLNSGLVREIVAELTFGGKGITNPDIALQPLVPMGDRHLGWAPNLVLSSSLERNLLVLLNRLPESREVYSKLVEQLEGRMIDFFRRALVPLGFRLWSGNVSGWGTASDLDLVIVDDCGKCVLVLELKSFLAPADPREVADKAAAIERGVKQISLRQEEFCKRRSSLDTVLKTDQSFSVHFAVASDSAVCCGMAQVGDAAVVRSTHLIDRITRHGKLAPVCEWLRERHYLPVPDRDFEKVEFPATVGGWTLDWYQIRPLAKNYC